MPHPTTTADTSQTTATASGERLVLLPEVRARVPIDRSTIWRMTREGRFPQPVAIGLRRLAWRESEIDQWIASRERRG